MDILKPRTFFKPFDYPWAFTLWKQHEAVHWMGYEVTMHEDVRDWNENLSKSEKSLLTHLFRFFTQADVDVAEGYTTRFLPYFAHKPELAMMMSSFAARESVHIDAYALLLETVGMPETTYQQFQEYKEMRDKHEYTQEYTMDSEEDVLKSLAVYSAFTEGMQLFASFAVLLNFPRHNKMKNMSNIVAWSIRDEDMHVEGMTTVFRTYLEQYLETLGSDKEREAFTEKLIREVRKIAEEMVTIEDHFIDLIFSDAEAVEGLTPEQVKAYIRFISNKRWAQLGFQGSIYSAYLKNPLPWIEEMVNAPEHANFFESKSTEYGKAMTEGSFDDIEF